ncbi:roadblock/LC7 domain-containing protein [Lysobacter sp. 5GHs7-4]|uniref:roadblock/LC7 domain-containing protein n=1 Tax=Lysobacter sp. 5GHs7-4 TaxID=2904253 RepID=UPI0018117E3A|nr:roadblock/LC7 domain-containing protein [Lysobacter sp. 5GHs7-4]NUO75363.1 roadblock/LC7 domain-containing protein [Lysobacter sp.]UHQ23568.1 roadblock/LC7 domain-containing protein [Lysobacter sp. 5GHs7-4]
MSAHELRLPCRDMLEVLVSQTLGVDSAAVVTGDGFEVAAVLREGVAGERLAAMVSSLLALSEAVALELRMSGCRNVIVETETGAVVTLRVPVSGHELLMSVLCSDAASLGSVLYAARDTARALGQRLTI